MQLCSASSSSPNVFFCNIMERFFGETWKTIFYFGETCKWIFKDGELVKEHTWWNVKMKIIVSEWWIGKCIFLVNGESPTKTYQFVTPVPKSDIWFESYTPHGNTRILHPFWRKSIENKNFLCISMAKNVVVFGFLTALMTPNKKLGSVVTCTL